MTVVLLIDGPASGKEINVGDKTSWDVALGGGIVIVTHGDSTTICGPKRVTYRQCPRLVPGLWCCCTCDHEGCRVP